MRFPFGANRCRVLGFRALRVTQARVRSSGSIRPTFCASTPSPHIPLNVSNVGKFHLVLEFTRAGDLILASPPFYSIP